VRSCLLNAYIHNKGFSSIDTAKSLPVTKIAKCF
jgi:hypothetical protein